MVPSLAAALRAVGLDCANHHLDSQHYPYLLRLAFAHAWSSVVGSWLDYAAGIRIRGNDRCNYRASPIHTTGGSSVFNGIDALWFATVAEQMAARECEITSIRDVLYNPRAHGMFTGIQTIAVQFIEERTP
jgi:hypothetical protein